MRMGGISCLRRRSADGDHTHALVAQQSHSFPDNLVALLGHNRAWHCSAENASSAVSVTAASLYFADGAIVVEWPRLMFQEILRLIARLRCAACASTKRD